MKAIIIIIFTIAPIKIFAQDCFSLEKVIYAHYNMDTVISGGKKDIVAKRYNISDDFYFIIRSDKNEGFCFFEEYHKNPNDTTHYTITKQMDNDGDGDIDQYHHVVVYDGKSLDGKIEKQQDQYSTIGNSKKIRFTSSRLKKHNNDFTKNESLRRYDKDENNRFELETYAVKDLREKDGNFIREEDKEKRKIDIPYENPFEKMAIILPNDYNWKQPSEYYDFKNSRNDTLFTPNPRKQKH